MSFSASAVVFLLDDFRTLVLSIMRVINYLWLRCIIREHSSRGFCSDRQRKTSTDQQKIIHCLSARMLSALLFDSQRDSCSQRVSLLFVYCEDQRWLEVHVTCQFASALNSMFQCLSVVIKWDYFTSCFTSCEVCNFCTTEGGPMPKGGQSFTLLYVMLL